MAGKNVGYAKFADRASASEAITALHGKIVNGVRLKVRLADSPSEEPNKRQRTYWAGEYPHPPELFLSLKSSYLKLGQAKILKLDTNVQW